jgi:REP element-mobilizing transposase RayT
MYETQTQQIRLSTKPPPHSERQSRAFVTFTTHKRWVLPAAARDIVLNSCLHLNGTKIRLHAAVVMPEHVHIICSMLRNASEEPHSFAEVLNPVKGHSAHMINKLLNRTGAVWLDESLDHVLRSQEKLESRVEYLRQNPVRRGLVKDPSQYRWLWVEPAFAQPRTAVPHENRQPSAAKQKAGK